ncbi:YfbM family protein [Fusobacterium sp.]|uniref:YfbM family protein n=1 Tax=Fusobacterium sp. TaxID=68766 RepID=UPI0025BCE93A|nr:YfbM family protein [Fusobacterium sp.]MCI7222921.1 YfbM family protein [Fusobacterium sp.]
MGLIANYQFISDEKLEELKNLDTQDDEFFEIIEEENEEAEILLDIDKMWDTLHFVLTGVGSDKPIENNPLSEAIVGVTTIEGIEEFVAYTKKGEIAKIIKALNDFDMESAMEKFDMQKCKKADLYPDIWDYEDEVDEIKEELLDYFENMKDFYNEVLENNGNVLVTIY